MMDPLRTPVIHGGAVKSSIDSNQKNVSPCIDANKETGADRCR
ncbi:hypothetical protein C5167_014856 [Papaver somniferum]|uniref:Uncharacterized protein n=1 Tax=Papaver somniferum TaxID=3469 RepID=A0A4Y7J8Q4_PAPSO|nr:hypothetical protein C5167_014852 [Papaver somniferum]RZC55998.1 hypothetical protein C5167_014856 [Papaver somniferum]